MCKSVFEFAGVFLSVYGRPLWRCAKSVFEFAGLFLSVYERPLWRCGSLYLSCWGISLCIQEYPVKVCKVCIWVCWAISFCILETPVKVCDVCPRRQQILGTALTTITASAARGNSCTGPFHGSRETMLYGGCGATIKSHTMHFLQDKIVTKLKTFIWNYFLFSLFTELHASTTNKKDL